MKTPARQSHPAVRFEMLPTVEGPLSRLNADRERIIADVVARTQAEFDLDSLESALGEALYSERSRLRRARANFFTRKRIKADHRLWASVQGGLLRPSAQADRQKLLEQVVHHFADEIAGRFDPGVYRFATVAVPWGFSWMLNAASVRQFMPWRMTESLQSRMHIVGEVTHLQELARKGTVLLVPTHQSNIDSVLIGYVIYLLSLPPFAYGAGLNLFSNPALSFFMSHLGAYTVDRLKQNEIYKQTLKNYSTAILREGVHSIFFPGGGRSRSGAIESKLKLGLLGTALQAQIENLQAGNGRNIYVVPMVMSYHFVLEAGSLIEDYLAATGKHRFIMMDDESWQAAKVARFFWKFFSSQSGVTIRIGKPMDVIGNPVDWEGRSLGPNGTSVNVRRWLSSFGELRSEPQRDREYTRLLGERITESFHRENTVLTSHLVAFSLFEMLREKYPELDLYRFVRLSQAQRTVPYEDFVKFAERQRQRLREYAAAGKLYLCDELRDFDTEKWITDGVGQLGALHEAAVARTGDGTIWTEDMSLLYYYRNRLAGYGLMGRDESKGFLA